MEAADESVTDSVILFNAVWPTAVRGTMKRLIVDERKGISAADVVSLMANLDS